MPAQCSQSNQPNYKLSSRWTLFTLGSNKRKLNHKKKHSWETWAQLPFLFNRLWLSHLSDDMQSSIYQRALLLLWPRLFLCSLISVVELSQPPQEAQCLLNQARSIFFCRHNGQELHPHLHGSLFFPKPEPPLRLFLMSVAPENSTWSLGFC